MRKILFSLLAMLFTLTMSAQSNGTVYFGNIDKRTSVGLGINGNDVTLSIMEVNKSKSFDKFEILFYDMDGRKVEYNMKEDTIYHLDLDKSYAHQKDYKMDFMTYNNILKALDSQSYVIIDGTMCNGAAFAGVLRSLQTEQNLFLQGKLQGVTKVSLWSWQQGGMGMMRFRHPMIPRNRGFRYVRTQEPPKRPQPQR